MLKIVVSLLTAIIVGSASPSWAVKLSTLVAERAEIEYGLEMPATGSFEISYFNFND